MKKIILISLAGVLVLFTIAFCAFPGQLGYLEAKIELAFKPFVNNSTLKIKYTGVLDEDGNLAAAGTSISITAETMDGYDFGVVGTLKNGVLSIVLPPIPKEHMKEYDEGVKYALLSFFREANSPYNKVELESNDGDYIDFWYFSKRTDYDESRKTVKGWNFASDDDAYLWFKLDHIPSRYKWVYKHY